MTEQPADYHQPVGLERIGIKENGRFGSVLEFYHIFGPKDLNAEGDISLNICSKDCHGNKLPDNEVLLQLRR